MAQINGFDISTHQGAVDWDKIQEAYNRGEIGFVILRAGYGGGGVDGQFARNCAEARNRGIPRQFYFFAYPGRSGGRAQAEEFAARVGQLQQGESVSLDIEDEPTYGRRLVAADVQWCLDFLVRATELLGVKPLIYMNSDVKGRFNWQPVVDGDYGLWIANYGPNNGQPNGEGPAPAPWKFWALWQYTSKANVAGITPIDMNLFSGDKEAFLKYGLQGSAPAPTPKPPTPTPTPPPSSTFTVGKSIKGYVTAADAAARKNSNSTVPAGTYAIFNTSKGMLNITRTPGAPGWWINPADNGTAPAPPQSQIYTVQKNDTVDGICAKFNISKANNYQAFRSMNPNSGHGGDWTNIWPGDKVRVK